MNVKNIKFRASGVGKLMIGSHGLTSKQLELMCDYKNRRDNPTDPTSIVKGLTEGQSLSLINLIEKHENSKLVNLDGVKYKSLTAKQISTMSEYENRRDNPTDPDSIVKPLTENQLEVLNDLIRRNEAPFELSETAKSFVDEMWLQKEHGFRQPLYNREIIKGRVCEEDALELISVVYGDLYLKNLERLTNDFVTGEPDVITKDYVRDTKVNWSIKQFYKIDEKIKEEYYAQGQVYMWLTGTNVFHLDYCLINTPKDLVMDIQRRLFWNFKVGLDGNSMDDAIDELQKTDKEFRRAFLQIEKNHNYDHVPNEQRVKTFTFEYDEGYINELVFRIAAAREYYKTITL